MKNKTRNALGVVVVFLLIMVVTASISMAKIVKTEEGVIVTHYPEKFDKIGTLDGIDKHGIVVEDIFFPFSDRIKFMTPYLEHATASSFEKGQRVGLVIGKGQKLKALCLMYSD